MAPKLTPKNEDNIAFTKISPPVQKDPIVINSIFEISKKVPLKIEHILIVFLKPRQFKIFLSFFADGFHRSPPLLQILLMSRLVILRGRYEIKIS